MPLVTRNQCRLRRGAIAKRSLPESKVELHHDGRIERRDVTPEQQVRRRGSVGGYTHVDDRDLQALGDLRRKGLLVVDRVAEGPRVADRGDRAGRTFTARLR